MWQNCWLYAMGTVDSFAAEFGICSNKDCGINDPYVDNMCIHCM